MLLDLLLLLVPRKITLPELKFHETLVVNLYQEYYDTLVGTAFRDRHVLSEMQKIAGYSMAVLFWYNFNLWVHIKKLHLQAAYLKRSVVSEEALKSLRTP